MDGLHSYQYNHLLYFHYLILTVEEAKRILYTYGTRDTLHYALHGTLEEKRKRTLVD